MAPHQILRGQARQIPWQAIWSVSQLLDFFGYQEYGAQVIQAIQDTLVDGHTLTAELGGTASTQEVGDAVCGHMKKLLSKT